MKNEYRWEKYHQDTTKQGEYVVHEYVVHEDVVVHDVAMTQEEVVIQEVDVVGQGGCCLLVEERIIKIHDMRDDGT